MLKGQKREGLTRKQRCDRCRQEDDTFTMSIFNTDWICMSCADKETRHPKYEEARKIEAEACKAGDYNFRGVGLPDDLRR